MAVKGLNGTARIARKNERITFQKNAVTVDRYGNHMSVWTDYAPMRQKRMETRS